jgi:Spy/CpxP family protein refolding chaperone
MIWKQQGDIMSATKKKSILLLIAALFFVSSGVAYAQCPGKDCNREDRPPMHGEKGPGQGPMIPDLTDEQREQIKDLRVDVMEKMLSFKNRLGEKAARLRTLQTAAKANMSEINKAIEEIGKLRIEMMKLKAACHQEIRSLLTDEQRVFFDAHHPSHDGPGEHHGPPAHGPR